MTSGFDFSFRCIAWAIVGHSAVRIGLSCTDSERKSSLDSDRV